MPTFCMKLLSLPNNYLSYVLPSYLFFRKETLCFRILVSIQGYSHAFKLTDELLLVLLVFLSPEMPMHTIKCFEKWIPMKLAMTLDL